MPRGLVKKNRSPGDEYFDVSVTVKFSEGQIQQMNERKKETGVPISTQIRRALERDLAAEQQQVQEPAAPPPDAITISIQPDEQERLRTLVRPFGYRVLEHFIEDLALRSLDKTPRAVQEYLLGEFLKIGEEAEAKERARLQALRDKKNGKAA